MKFIGIDIGEVSFKAVWLNTEKKIKGIFRQNHGGEIRKIWEELKTQWGIDATDLVVTTGTSRNILPFSSVPEMVAQKKALHFLRPNEEITLIRLAGGGFSVLKNRDGKSEYQRNPECAAGTGAFLDQNLSRFDLATSEADQIIDGIEGLKLSGRCAVFLKTEATHAVNAGGQKEKAIAGLFDATARNAVALAEKSALTKKTFSIGGLSGSKRITQTIQQELSETKVEVPPQALYWEALGAALIATEPNLPKVKAAAKEIPLVFLPPLKDYLGKVTKIELPETQISSAENLVLGLDIGSTGSKLVIFGEIPIFEVYVETKGDPVQAAKNLIQKVPVDFLNQVKTVGVTGSGREIVGPLLISLFSEKQIFVLNEIVAHATGAIYYNPEVDTIIDIGGQDAKFALLQNSVLVDSAMNTACSAGTGSFKTEQLPLLGISDVRKMGEISLEAPRAVDLGEHCAVFIAKQISQAQRKGATIPEIVAGLDYSIARNYDHRVKGSRQYGKCIFLQGKPAENISLALALSKVSGQPIIVPPSPGIMGALGIALLAKQEVENLHDCQNLKLERFLASKVIDVGQFVCHSKDGCEKGNQCKIKVLEVELEGKTFKFFWNGRCDKYEKTKKNTVLAKAPQPFLERERLISKLIVKNSIFSTKTVGIPRGLETEGILPLAIVFFQSLGFNVKLLKNDVSSLEQGTKICQSDFCAPLQCLAGEAKKLEKEDFIFLPKVIEIEAHKGEERCCVCPLSQAAPDMLSPKLSGKILKPFLNFKEGYEKNLKEFVLMGLRLGIWPWETLIAFRKAVKAQKEFEKSCQKIGKETLEFGKTHHIPVVVVLGHPYIIHSQLLNAGVPEIILEKGGLALPSDCYPLKGLAPNLKKIYWGYGHKLLDVAYEVRRESAIFDLCLSAYSCGIDSFIDHFFQYLSKGKPYCLLETDAHTGKAGFATRIEAFIYGIRNYKQPKNEQNLTDLSKFDSKGEVLSANEKRKVLIPWMGEGSMLAPALLKTALGINAECLPMADEEALELGRKHTSGKECLPMIVTLGSLIKYLKNHPGEKVVYFMPSANGPCRFGQYHIFTQIVLEETGLDEWVKVISPNSETGYFLNKQFGPAMRAKAWATFVFVDLLKDALHEIRPAEKTAGEADKLFSHILKLAKANIMISPNDWSGFKNLWGFTELAKLAVLAFKKIPIDEALKDQLLSVLVAGEVFLRHDEFSNQKLVRQLEALGVKVKLAGFREWINYTLFQRRKGMTVVKTPRWKLCLTWLIQKTIEECLYRIFAKGFDWPKNHSVDAILKAAKPHLSKLRPQGEAALTIGLPLLLHKAKEIKGAVISGPFECMPTRTAVEILMMASEKDGPPILNLSFHGDSIDGDLLESYVWELRMNA